MREGAAKVREKWREMQAELAKVQAEAEAAE